MKRKKNGNKEKRKERRIPDQRSKGSEKGKEVINERKRTEILQSQNTQVLRVRQNKH